MSIAPKSTTISTTYMTRLFLYSLNMTRTILRKYYFHVMISEKATDFHPLTPKLVNQIALMRCLISKKTAYLLTIVINGTHCCSAVDVLALVSTIAYTRLLFSFHLITVLFQNPLRVYEAHFFISPTRPLPPAVPALSSTDFGEILVWQMSDGPPPPLTSEADNL